MNIYTHAKRALGLGTALAALSTAGVAIAQDEAAGGPAAGAGLGGVGDIVVTARKRAETTQDVPVAITAFSAEAIEHKALISLESVSASTPQFSIGRAATGSGAQLTLRGIGSTATSIGIEQSVAVVVDGVYYGQGRTINEGLFDLARLEILKGPQALFYGKNATAGVISIATADPTSKPEFKARAGYEFQARQIIGELIGSGPLADNLGIRVALRGTKMYGGYFKNLGAPTTYTTRDVVTGISTVHPRAAADADTPQSRDLLGRVTLKWEPADRLAFTLKATTSKSDNNNGAYNFVLFNCPGGTARLNPAITCGRNFKIYQSNQPDDIAATRKYGKSDGRLGNQYHAYALTGTLEYGLDDLDIVSVTNYNSNQNTSQLDASYEANPTSTQFYNERTKFRAFSNETRIITKYDGSVNFLAGLYYQTTKRELEGINNNGGRENSNAPSPDLRYTSHVKDSYTDGETLSGYGQLIWKATPQLELTSGVRYIHETKDSAFEETYVHPTLAGVGAFLPNSPIFANQTFSNWSPEATISYKPTGNINIYASYKTAYKSGGFSNSALQNSFTTVNDLAFGPEKARGFEAGLKATLFDRQLRINLGAYHYKFVDLQVDFFDAATVQLITYNAGSVKQDGIEADFVFAPRSIDGLSITGSVNYNDARYGNFPQAPCYGGQTIAEGCAIVAGKTIQDLSGAPVANAPKWTAALGVNHETPISDTFVLGLSADARYSGAYIVSSFGDPNANQPKYLNLDAAVRLRTADDQWELSLIGKNLTNRFYVSGVFDVTATANGTGTAASRHADLAGFANPPRTLMLQATWRY